MLITVLGRFCLYEHSEWPVEKAGLKEIHTEKKDLGKLRSEAQVPYSYKTDILRSVKGNTVSFCMCSISASLP